MGVLCLVADCYVCCLEPTPRVPFMGDTITARSSTTNGEQELRQSAHTWILPTRHAQEHGATYRQGQGRTVGERGMLNQVRDTKPANRTRTPSQISEERRVHRHVRCQVHLPPLPLASPPLLPCLLVIFSSGIIALSHLCGPHLYPPI